MESYRTLSRQQLRDCLLLVDEVRRSRPAAPRGGGVAAERRDAGAQAIEYAGGDSSQFPGRERLNKGLGTKGLHRAGEPDPWRAQPPPHPEAAAAAAATQPPPLVPPGLMRIRAWARRRARAPGRSQPAQQP